MQSAKTVKLHNNQLTVFKILSSSIHAFNEQNPQPTSVSHHLTELKIMYSPNLASLQGIHIYPNLVKLNLSGNAINSLSHIGALKNLEQLNVSTNRLTSLKGIQNCQKLRKIIATHNLVENLVGFEAFFPDLQLVDLAGNKIKNCEELRVFSKIKSLKQLILQKKNASNPICSNRLEYVGALYENKLLQNIAKIDGKLPMELFNELQLFIKKGQNSVQNFDSNFYNSNNMQDNKNYVEHTQTRKNHAKKSQKNQRARQLEDVIIFKEQVIEELKSKLHHLEIQNTDQYRQNLKKEAQIERLCAQLSQFSKQIQTKESKLSQVQNRVEQMLKSGATANKTIELKNQQLEKLNRQICDLKVQNAEYRALNKDYEKRLSEIHEKALKNVQQSTTRSEQLKHKCESLYGENRDLVRDINECKNRIRQLTELLREYEFKFEAKKNEMQNRFKFERTEIVREFEQKEREAQKIHEEEKRRWTTEMKNEVQQIEEKYKSALEQTMSMYTNTKKQLDERKSHDSQINGNIKALKEKNIDQERLIQDLQGVLIKLRQELVQIMNDKERFQNELIALRTNKGNHIKMLNDEVSKLQYERSVLEKQIQDQRDSTHALNKEVQAHVKLQSELEGLESKVESLRQQIEVQTAMLEDKNQTIESLKSELEALKGEQGQREEETVSLQKKLQKNKQKLSTKDKELAEMADYSTELENQLKEKQQVIQQKLANEAKIIDEIQSFKDIIDQQAAKIDDKDTKIGQLATYLAESKKSLENMQTEIDQARRELARNQHQLKELEYKHRKQLSEIKLRYQNDIRKAHDEATDLKNNLTQMKSFLNKMPF